MDKYLTTKAAPGKFTVLLEIIAVVVTGLALLLWLAVGIYGFLADGLGLAHVFVLLFALPEALVLFFVLRRWYDRSRAKRIVSLLCTSERGKLTCGELSKAGVYSPAQAITKLTVRRYICNIVEALGVVSLKRQDMQHTVCAYCGASVPFQQGMDKCPSCGARTVK